MMNDVISKIELNVERKNIEIEIDAVRVNEGNHNKCIEVSHTEPIDKNIMLWYQIDAESGEETEINLNEFFLNFEGNDLIMNYQDDLDLNFEVVNNELIVNNGVSDLDFTINEEKEMEVSYE